MRTNIVIDDDLMAEAMVAAGVKTMREAVHEALSRMVRAKRQRDAWEALRGTGWQGNLDDMRTDKPLPLFE